MKIEKEFYLSDKVVNIARNLIGKYIFVNHNGLICGGYITETEAYEGTTDKASHAYQNKRTNRTEVMYAQGGRTYVYLCYGIHSMLNIVTGEKELPHAVLIRGFKPTLGLNEIRARLGKDELKKNNFDGPGKLTKALGIDVRHNNLCVFGNEIWLEDCGMKVSDDQIISAPRVGIDYAENGNGVKVKGVNVINNYEINGNENPHKSYGYLRTPEFSNLLSEFLTKDVSTFELWQLKTKEKLIKFFKKIRGN